MTPTSTDVALIDSALRLIDREIWIVTAADGDRRGGLVATWVSAASIDRDRPALLAGIGPNHFTAELVQKSKALAAHLLRPDQVELAWNFAADSGRARDKLAGLAVETGPTGSPILADCLAWFDCRVFARYDAGDRLFFWADVVAASVAGTLRVPSPANGPRSVPATSPLRESEFFRHLTPDQRQTLSANRAADAALSRPLQEQWKRQNPW